MIKAAIAAGLSYDLTNATAWRMSKFVNYKKRDIALPPGCKDLIDVLRPRRPSKSHGIIPREQLAVTRGESEVVALGELRHCVRRAFQSNAYAVILMIGLRDDSFWIHFHKMGGELTQASANMQENAERERLIRQFLFARALKMPEADWTSKTHLIPGVPVVSLFQISPLPADPAAAAALFVDLFRSVCGLADTDSIEFRHYEVESEGDS